MKTFTFKARDKFGKIITGHVEAEDPSDVMNGLAEKGYVPVSVQEKSAFALQAILDKYKKVKKKDLNMFTRLLLSSQKAGMPLVQSLDAIGMQVEDECLSDVIRQVSDSLRGGDSFSSAISKHPKAFDDIYVNMIKAAETGGKLIDVLASLIEILERDIETSEKVKAATRYPILTLGALAVGFLIVVTFVIPKFANIFAQFDVPLPLPTRFLIGTYSILTGYWYLIILLVGAVIYGFIRFIHSRAGRLKWDRFKLKVPVVGPLLSMVILSRLSRVMALLMKSGVPILHILNLAADTAGNAIFSDALMEMSKGVRDGRGISAPMQETGLFPPIVIQMVYMGEKSGNMPELLINVAEYYDMESDYLLKNMTTYIEPILIFFLGIMVLILALGIFLPMWNLVRVFQ